MKNINPFARALFFSFFLTCLLIGLTGIVDRPVNAAPKLQTGAQSIVISEFRSRGATAGDEFVELFNPTSNSIDISDWTVRKSSGCGTSTSELETITTIPAGPIWIAPGQYYLIASPDYSGPTNPDIQSGSNWSISDTGGVAILDSGNAIIDQAGMCDTTEYVEGDALAPITTAGDRSYERNDGNSVGSCFDENDNDTDFRLLTSSDPQNSSSQLIPCLVVTDVTSSASNYPITYSEGDTLYISIEFSSSVNVTGTPSLTLETGTNDTEATYSSGSGTDTLLFEYIVVIGDVSGDLDYVSTGSLSLNGGTITGAVGNAVLTLPAQSETCPVTVPPTPCSLGANKDIVIDNGISPSTVSFERQDPSSNPTNADNLTFRVTFSEPVLNVDSGDFTVVGTTGTPSVSVVNSSIYDITISGGDLAGLNGTVGLNLSGGQDITDAIGTSLPAGEPAVDETYSVDNAQPTVTVNQAGGQSDPASGTPIEFTIVFFEEIDTSTFTTNDITQNGTANFITWDITNSGDDKTFTLSAITVGQNGTLIPSISANQVLDLAGNNNLASTSTDNTVTFNDNVPPSVTINQASGQADPTTSLPVRFTIVFSEPIVTSIFTTSDITQNGTATGITWSIANSGDDTTFTLSATAISGTGTVIPTIAANRVTDPVGNNNLASTSTDNTVTYNRPPPTPTRTPLVSKTSTPKIPLPPPLVAINEFVPRPGHDWNNDGIVNTDDEYIELLNHGTVDVNLSGYRLDDEVNIGSDPYRIPSILLKPGERIVFYGSETGLLLSDGGDGVRLLKPNGQLEDAYNYSVVEFPDQSFCRLPDNGGLDDWNTNCYPTPGLRNSLSGSLLRSPTQNNKDELLCPIADTLPEGFVIAECDAFGHNIWNRYYWDKTGWYDEMSLPNVNGKWDLFAD